MLSEAHGFEGIDLQRDILIKHRDDMALFEVDGSIYTGHYFFVSRGDKAYDVARLFLDFIFTEYPVEVIKGLTPVYHRGALWLTKKLGFTDYGIADTVAGEMRLSLLTRREYNERNLRRQ